MNLSKQFKGKNIHIFLFYSLLFFITIALAIKFNEVDYDLWARLIQGKFVFFHGYPMKEDIISYTPTHVWYDPEWLLSGIIYFINTKFSFCALIYLKGICCFTMLAIIVQALKARKINESPYNIGYYILLLLVLEQSGIIVYTFRCQLITFILTGIWILLLEKIKQGKNYLLILLPLIMVFWLNMHGGAIAPVGILFFYCIGEFLNKNKYKKYTIAFFFVCLVFFINPWGVDFITFMIKSAYLDRSWISEWTSSFNTGGFSSFIFYKFMLLVGISAYIYKIYKYKLTYSKINKTKLILVFALAVLSAQHIKHIGLLIMIYSIYLYEDYYLLYNDAMEKLRKYLQISLLNVNNLRIAKSILIYLSIFIYSFVLYFTNPIRFSYSKSTIKNYPVYAVEFLKVNNIKGNIYAPFYISTYIAYKLYPNAKIFMDGRQEQVYSSELFDLSMFFLNHTGAYPEKAIDLYPPDILILDKNSNASFFNDSKKYTKVFADKKFSVYLKPSLAKFNYNSPTEDEKYYIDNLFKSNI